MMQSGLVSISFRALDREQIVKAVAKAGLQSIEWGGDVHVPHGDVKAAKNARNLCRDEGIDTPTYGSYYRLGSSENPDFQGVLDCASELEANMVRIWAGNKTPSSDIDADQRASLVDECRLLCSAAQKHSVKVATEYHAQTLTDTNESAQSFFAEVGHPNLRTYWQPPNGRSFEYCLDGLSSIVHMVDAIHVFHWGESGGNDRRPLSEGAERWLSYLRTARGYASQALMEFVVDDDVENFYRDAEVLKNWLQTVNSKD